MKSVERAVSRLYSHVRLDMAGDKTIAARVERQDLDEMLGNLIENAAKYGGGSVFVTVEDAGEFVEMLVEDDGRGIPEAERERIFDRGARLDTGKPGTGLGLAIVRDVVEIYGGTVTLRKARISVVCLCGSDCRKPQCSDQLMVGFPTRINHWPSPSKV